MCGGGGGGEITEIGYLWISLVLPKSTNQIKVYLISKVAVVVVP